MVEPCCLHGDAPEIDAVRDIAGIARAGFGEQRGAVHPHARGLQRDQRLADARALMRILGPAAPPQ